jgi:hypothetical protein
VTDEADGRGFANENLLRLSDFAEFYRKTAWDTFANSAKRDDAAADPG